MAEHTPLPVIGDLAADDLAVIIEALDESYPPEYVNVPVRVRQLRSFLAHRAALLDLGGAAA